MLKAKKNRTYARARKKVLRVFQLFRTLKQVKLSKTT